MAYDFRVVAGFTRTGKFLQLRDRLGDACLWSVMDLWSYATEHYPNGTFHKISDRHLEFVSNWAGEPGAFVSCMMDVGLLEGPEYQRHIHDWQVHNSYVYRREDRQESGRRGADAVNAKLTPEQRSENARKAAFARHGKVYAVSADSAEGVRGTCAGPSAENSTNSNTSARDCAGPCALPFPYPEEYIAPESSAHPRAHTRGENSGQDGTEPATAPGIGWDTTTGAFTGITPEHVELWKSAFPDVRIQAEILQATAYYRAHPARISQAKAGIRLLSWLKRAQPEATPSTAQRPLPAPEPQAAPEPKPVEPLVVMPSSTFDWEGIRAILKVRLDTDTFAKWIQPIEYLGIAIGAAVLVVADTYTAKHIQDNFLDRIKDAIWDHHHRIFALHFMTREVADEVVQYAEEPQAAANE